MQKKIIFTSFCLLISLSAWEGCAKKAETTPSSSATEKYPVASVTCGTSACVQ